jgi:hypothetical protein
LERLAGDPLLSQLGTAPSALAAMIGLADTRRSWQELSAPFTPSSGWSIASISPERLQARFAPEGAPAWLAKIERIESHD